MQASRVSVTSKPGAGVKEACLVYCTHVFETHETENANDEIKKHIQGNKHNWPEAGR